MVNVFKQLVKENEEKREKYTNELKEAGFTDKDIRECMDIYRLINPLMSHEIDIEVNENSDISYNNGYVKGLYEGAKIQSEYITTRLINNKIYSVKTNANVTSYYIYVLIKKLHNVLLVDYEIVTPSAMFNENIAVVGRKELHDCTEEYYVVARKDNEDKNYEYLMIDSDGLQKDYKLTESEMELFK